MGTPLYKHFQKLTFILLIFTCGFDLVFLDTIYEGPHFVEKDTEFTITCYTFSTINPKWSRNGDEIVATSNIEKREFDKVDNIVKNVLTVKEADITDAGKYKCDFFDDLYHEIFIITGINGNDGPSIRDMEVNKPFTLECNVSVVSENASVGVNWFKNGEPINSSNSHIIVHDNVLEIKRPIDDDWGIYMCQPNVTDSISNFTFIVNTKPRIEPPFQKSVSHIQGESLTLICPMFGKPDPDVQWLKGDEIITANDSRIKIEKTETGSELKISSLEEDDRAEYTCLINNTAGTANSTILVRVKDKLAALWPFLGIVAEVGVLCTIIFIYEKRRAKQEFEESDTDQSPDTKNIADNKEKDVRQRK